MILFLFIFNLFLTVFWVVGHQPDSTITISLEKNCHQNQHQSWWNQRHVNMGHGAFKQSENLGEPNWDFTFEAKRRRLIPQRFNIVQVLTVVPAAELKSRVTPHHALTTLWLWFLALRSISSSCFCSSVYANTPALYIYLSYLHYLLLLLLVFYQYCSYSISISYSTYLIYLHIPLYICRYSAV